MRKVALELATTRGERTEPVYGREVTCRFEQPGLPDPRRTLEVEERAAPGRGALKRRRQPRQLSVALEEDGSLVPANHLETGYFVCAPTSRHGAVNARRVPAVGLLSVFLGGGKMKPEVRAELEAEGLVLVEERVRGSLYYTHFKAPGKRFHGKVVPMRLAIGLSERRLVIYGGVGAPELVDSPFDSPRLQAVDVLLDGDDTAVIHIDYSRMEEAAANGVSGEIRIKMKPPNAPDLVAQINARLGR